MYAGKIKKAIIYVMVFYFTLFLIDYFSHYFGAYFFYAGMLGLIVVYVKSIFDSYLAANNDETYTLKNYNKWYYYILYAIAFYAIAVFDITYLFQNFNIPASSMENSLLIGDHIICNKISSNEPKRGDIVIFKYPLNVKVHYVKRCVGLPGDQLFVKDKELYLRPSEGDMFINANYPKDDIVTINGKLWVKNPYIKQHPGIHHDDTIQGDTPILLASDGSIEKVDTPEKMAILAQNSYQLPQNIKMLQHNPIFQTEVTTVPQGTYFMMGDNRDHSNDSRFWGPVPYANLEGTAWFIYFSIDNNFGIRWERIGKTPADLEQPENLKRVKLTQN